MGHYSPLLIKEVLVRETIVKEERVESKKKSELEERGLTPSVFSLKQGTVSLFFYSMDWFNLDLGLTKTKKVREIRSVCSYT